MMERVESGMLDIHSLIPEYMYQNHQILQLVSFSSFMTIKFLNKMDDEIQWEVLSLTVGKNNGPSSSSVQQSHQIFCCAFNASGTVFVTGSSDTLARVYPVSV